MCECVCGYTETSCAFYSTIFYKVLLSYIYIVTVNKKKNQSPKKHAMWYLCETLQLGWTECEVQETPNEQSKHKYLQCIQHILKLSNRILINTSTKIGINRLTLFFNYETIRDLLQYI